MTTAMLLKPHGVRQEIANRLLAKVPSLFWVIESAQVALMLALTRMASQNTSISVFEEKVLFVSSPYQANFTK